MSIPETQYTITVTQLADALERWEVQAAHGNWPKRSDAARHRDAADTLLVFMETGIWPSDA